MMAAQAFSEDALRLYALTMAYLHDAQIGNQGSTSAMHVKEISPDLFYIWQREQPAAPKQPIAPVAICTHNQVTHTWRVELYSGESLTLLDKESVWDIVGETKNKPVRKGPKKQRQLRKRKKV